MAVLAKNILFEKEARESLMKGAGILARAVGVTLGPKGRNVSLAGKYSGAKTVHDGVTVAREIKLKDPTEDIGVILIRDAASKTNDITGDGTTTATVLAYEIAREANARIIAGVNPMILVRGLNKAVKEVVAFLEEMAEPIKGNLEKMIQIASLSAADEEIGKKIAEALEKVGEYGVVTVTSGIESGYTIEYKDGMEWDQGWVHPAFVLQMLDNKPNFKLLAKVEDPYILITDHSITSVDEILPLLTKLREKQIKNLLIISDGLERQAMTLLHENLVRGVFNILPVSAPSFGNHKRDGLEDIAVLTGGKFISKDLGMKISQVAIEDLGRADLATATQDSTVLIGGKGDIEKIKDRGKQIEEQIDQAEHELMKEKYKERLAKLTSGVAVVKVGMASDAERDEKIERVRDAIGATKAAVAGGIIPGGGVPLLRIAQKIKLDYPLEERIGAEILQKALMKPIKLLAENAGINGEVVVQKILADKDEEIGFDVITGLFVNLKRAGIVDPANVTISAMQNAVSVASMIITTEATITDLPEDEKKDQEVG